MKVYHNHSPEDQSGDVGICKFNPLRTNGLWICQAKKLRLYIVITHNPNLVLNTDAEQIIVANFDAVPKSQPSRIMYISGAIENSFVSEKARIPLGERGIREHGLDILEGGKIAFRKRREKYGKTAE